MAPFDLDRTGISGTLLYLPEGLQIPALTPARVDRQGNVSPLPVPVPTIGNLPFRRKELIYRRWKNLVWTRFCLTKIIKEECPVGEGLPAKTPLTFRSAKDYPHLRPAN